MARIQERLTAVNTFRQFVVTPSLFIQILYPKQNSIPNVLMLAIK